MSKAIRKTTEEWENENPVLEVDRLGVETTSDGLKTKVGDGATAWIDLPYVVGDALQDEQIDALSIRVESLEETDPQAITNSELEQMLMED